MLPVSLDCPFSLPLRYSLTFICPVSCVPYVASFSGLYFFIITPSVFSNRYLSCVLCTLCCQFLWIVLFYCSFGILQHLFVMCLVYPMLPASLDCPCLLPRRYYLTCICPVSCVPYGASFSGLSFFITPSVFSNIYLSCVSCTLCCQFLWIVLFITISVFSNMYLSCVLCTLCASFSGLSFLLPFRYSLTCMLPVSLDCPFLLPFRYSLTCICPVSCAPYVASFSGLSIFDFPFGILQHLFVLCLVYPMLPVSLDCPFLIAPSVFSNMYLSCVLCTQC